MLSGGLIQTAVSPLARAQVPVRSRSQIGAFRCLFHVVTCSHSSLGAGNRRDIVPSVPWGVYTCTESQRRLTLPLTHASLVASGLDNQ